MDPPSVTKMTFEHPRLLAASLVAALACSTSARAEDSTWARHDAASAFEAGARSFQVQDPQNPLQQGERARLLAQKYLEIARSLRAQGEPKAALEQLLKAKNADPGNQDVLREETAIRGILGEADDTGLTLTQEWRKRREVVEQRLRTLTRDQLQNARAAADEKNYAGALNLLRQARLNIVRGGEIGMDWGGLRDEVDQTLAMVEEQADEQQRQQRTDEEAALQAQLRRQYEEQEARIRSQVTTLLREAVEHFEDLEFEAAAEKSLIVLELQPTNTLAEDLHNASLKAAKQEAQQRYHTNKAKEVLRMLEGLEELKIPYNDILTLDRATFDRAKNRAKNRLPTADVGPEDEAMRAKVESTQTGKLSFNEDNGAYADVIKTLQTITGIPIIITQDGADALSGETMEIDMANSISLANFLNLMTERSESLTWLVRNGVVQITSKEAAGSLNLNHSFDVRDLIFPRTTFIAPTIRDVPTEEGGGFAEVSRTGGELEDKVAFVEIDTLLENVQAATDRVYWDDGLGTIEPNENGFLMVRASAEMLAKIQSVLDSMRQSATSVVTVDTKFLTVTRNFLQEVGVDFRGLGGTGNKGSVATLDDITNGLQNNASRGLDNGGTADPAGNPSAGAFFNDGGDGDIRARTENFFQDALGSALTGNGGLTASLSILDDLQIQAVLRAIEKNESSEVVNSQILTVLNKERGHVAVINQTAYVRDFDVEVAQASFVADPKVDVIQDGIVLDVKPVISFDRRFVLLSLEPTVAELTRPIPTFTTSLAGSTLPVTLQLPELTVTTFATTARVPDGGSVLIGGLRQVLNRERRAEIPLLANLPLISLLFKNEGVVDENRQLMVMVQAWITDMDELD